MGAQWWPKPAIRQQQPEEASEQPKKARIEGVFAATHQGIKSIPPRMRSCPAGNRSPQERP